MCITVQFGPKTRFRDEIAHHKIALHSEFIALFDRTLGYKSNAYLIRQYTYGLKFSVSDRPCDTPTRQNKNYFPLSKYI